MHIMSIVPSVARYEFPASSMCWGYSRCVCFYGLRMGTLSKFKRTSCLSNVFQWVSFIRTEFLKVLVRLAMLLFMFSVPLLINSGKNWTNSQTETVRKLQAVPLFRFKHSHGRKCSFTKMVEEQRKNLIAISCKSGYSFFILIQNFELQNQKHFPVRCPMIM
jgi:hypothetical protein